MRNEKLLDVIEDYVMKSYDVVRLKSDLSRNYKKKRRNAIIQRVKCCFS